MSVAPHVYGINCNLRKLNSLYTKTGHALNTCN
jgi:hypothetical protein